MFDFPMQIITTAISGVCRFCNAETKKEANWYKVQFLMTKYRTSVEELYHHGGELEKDNVLNPQYVCCPCADQVHDNHKQQQKCDYFKRQKLEKKYLPQFLSSPTDCCYKKCDHLKPEPAVLRAMWKKMDERSQCEFLAFLVTDIKPSLIKVGIGKNP